MAQSKDAVDDAAIIFCVTLFTSVPVADSVNGILVTVD